MEREIEVAEMETKLRKFVTELLRPTFVRVTQLEGSSEELSGRMQQNEQSLSDFEKIGRRVEDQVRNVDGFRSEMSRWDAERRAFQAEAQENMSAMRTDLDTFRYQLERGDSELHGVQRTVDRLVTELNRLQEGTEALRKHVDHRLTQTTKTMNTATTDLDVKLVGLETRFDRLNDELWGEETGLSKVISDLRNTDRLVDGLGEDIKDMQLQKATVSQLHAIQVEVNGLIGESNSTISVLRKSVDSALGNLKEHFQTATKTVAAHNAAMLAEVRKSYQEELSESAQTRNDGLQFMKKAGDEVARLECTLREQHERTEEALRNVTSEVEDVSKIRRRDKNSSDVEVEGMKTHLGQVHSNQQEVTKAIAHLSNVIWMLVDSENASSALDIQDDSDRGKVALMGYRDSKGSAQAKARSKAAKPTSNPQAPSEVPGPGPVVSLDHRCLSCSGQAQTVLAGFKIACLEYAPGPVTLKGKMWNRTELLDWRMKLLLQAREALSSGPEDLRRGDLSGSGGASRLPRSRAGTAMNATQSVNQDKALPAPAASRDSGGAHSPEKDRPESRNSSAASNPGPGSNQQLRMPPLTQRTVTPRTQIAK